MRGDDILAIQQRLSAAGFAVQQDGLYGQQTAAAIRQFQNRNGLKSDGVIEAATWLALFRDASIASGDFSSQYPASPMARLVEFLTLEKLAILKAEHRRYHDGCSWSLSPAGLRIDRAQASEAEKKLAKHVLAQFAGPLASALAQFPVPVELVIACICAESSGRPEALRLEPGCDQNNPEQTPEKVSAGLMQPLLSTARAALNDRTLKLSALADPAVSIAAGAAYMWRQGLETGFDPPLAAAAYNAGCIRYNGAAGNRWKLLQYPIGTSEHCDRFVRFFNAAIALERIDDFPNFRSLLTADENLS